MQNGFRKRGYLIALLLVVALLSASCTQKQGGSEGTSASDTSSSAALGTTQVSTVSSSSASSSEQSTAEATTETTSQSASNPAFEIGKLVGEPSAPFAELIPEVGLRPESGIVYDLKFRSEHFDRYQELSLQNDKQPIYRIPQISSSSESAKLFNRIMAEKAKFDLKQNVDMLESMIKWEDVEHRWVYVDYAVIEGPRYVSILLAKVLADGNAYEPKPRVESYVFDKRENLVLYPRDLVEDFGYPADLVMNAAENYFMDQNTEFGELDSYFYTLELDVTLEFLTDVFISSADFSTGRGMVEEWYHTNGFNQRMPVCFYVDRDEDLSMMITAFHPTGFSAETGNVKYDILLKNRKFRDLAYDERRVSPKFTSYHRDEDPGNVLAYIVYLGNRADEETASKIKGVLADGKGMGWHTEFMGGNRQVYAIIPKYTATQIVIEKGNGGAPSRTAGPSIIVTPVDPDGNTQVIVTARESWALINLPATYEGALPFEEGNDIILDITDRVTPVSEGLEEILNNLRFMLQSGEY